MCSTAPPGRASSSDAAYLEEGQRHLRRAQALHPDLDDAEALVVSVELDTEILRPRTVALYNRQIETMLRMLVGSDAERLSTLLERVGKALKSRRGRPAEPRTASRKVRDAAREEVTKVLGELAKRVWRGDKSAATLALNMFLMTRLGYRPVEGSTARLEGGVLVIRNAKVSEHRGGFPDRRLDMNDMHPLVRRAAEAFVPLIAAAIDQYGTYHAWHAAASELLARICKKVGIRRLCLSSLRHVALATWKRAGLAPWVVAALAGHASDRTAGRHYAGARLGWAAEGGLPRAEKIRVLLLEERYRLKSERARSPALSVSTGPGGYDVVEDMPLPTPRLQAEIDQGARYWQAWRDSRPDYGVLPDPDPDVRKPGMEERGQRSASGAS